MPAKMKKSWWIIPLVILVGVIILSLPPVRSRVVYYSREAYTDIKYWLKPPSEAVFVPSNNLQEDGAVATAVAATLTAYAPTTSLNSEISATPQLATPAPTLTPTPTPTPLPSSAYLPGVIGEPQLWNNCGPATLSMYLSFYKWGQTQNETAAVLKPNDRDKNVMPYEMIDYVNEYTAQRALWRYGGDLQTLKSLINAGFPVMIETGFEPANLTSEGWMGHYLLLVGYDDQRQIFTTQDSYLLSHPPAGMEAISETELKDFKGFEVKYDDLQRVWRAFNYVFIVVYPPEKENDVLNTLGPLATDATANQIAYDRAMQEATSLPDIRDRFFAWFNAGTSMVYLQDYATAAASYDTAFNLYPQIQKSLRPYRMLWYQTGPYFAYYFTGRYQDVINLANQTLKNMSEPVLEESYYWRALSYYALGDSDQAIEDLRTSVKVHPGFAPGVAMLEQFGETP
jgi:tetratricopeptide (TPR) repeat protein